MKNYKSDFKNIIEYSILALVLIFIILNGVIKHDALPAIISAYCGITYTFLAGKGLPVCYIFGVTGSAFYSLLAYQNMIWGNLLLYAGYYLPMQIIGYFKWNKNLQEGKKEIVKISLAPKELFLLIFILSIFSVIIYNVLVFFKDAHPLLDSITTVFSIGGMYLTVRRAIEQWIFWLFVNALSLAMWINVAIKGVKVYSTIAMWTVYLILALYFYLQWRKEIKSDKD